MKENNGINLNKNSIDIPNDINPNMDNTAIQNQHTFRPMPPEQADNREVLQRTVTDQSSVTGFK